MFSLDPLPCVAVARHSSAKYTAQTRKLIRSPLSLSLMYIHTHSYVSSFFQVCTRMHMRVSVYNYKKTHVHSQSTHLYTHVFIQTHTHTHTQEKKGAQEHRTTHTHVHTHPKRTMRVADKEILGPAKRKDCALLSLLELPLSQFFLGTQCPPHG